MKQAQNFEKLQKIKSVYFFVLGVFNVFGWNSILNLSDFFVKSFNNDNRIVQIYTLGFFIISNLLIPVSSYIDSKYSIYKTMSLFLLLMFVPFNLLYTLCNRMSVSSLKYIYFFLLMNLFITYFNENLSSALCFRFEERDSNLFYLGKAFAGLMTNIILFMVLLIKRTQDSVLIYQIYLWIANLGLFVFFCFQMRFFKYCKLNLFHQEKKNQKQDLENLIEFQDKSERKFEDMNKNFDENTRSYKSIFMENLQYNICQYINFTMTLITFPSLNFKLDFYLPSYIQYSIITLIFNFSDFLSRVAFNFRIFQIKSDSKALMLLVLKFVLIFINLACISSDDFIFRSIITKILVVFLQGFINGYLCIYYVVKCQSAFDSIYDKNRQGYICGYTIQAGLTTGSILSFMFT